MQTCVDETREEILARIAELENELAELRERLPNAVKPFYRFRMTRPARSNILIYASNRAEADRKVFDRLTGEYGAEGFTLHTVVDEFTDAEHVALNAATSSNLLSCLTPADAREFLADWEANHAGRVESGKRPSQLVQDIRDYKRQQALIEQSR